MSYSNPATPGMPGMGMPGQPPAPAKTSGVAIAALICSLLFCIPFITSAVGALLGLIGIFVTLKPGVRGRWLAVSALLLGLLGLAGWGVGTWIVVDRYVAPIQTVGEFSKAAAAGDLKGMTSFTTPPFDNNDLAPLAAKIKTLGRFVTIKQDTQKPPQMPLKETMIGGRRAYTFDGELIFSSGVQLCKLDLVHTDSGWKLSRFELTDAPSSSRPAGTGVEDFSDKPATKP